MYSISTELLVRAAPYAFDACAMDTCTIPGACGGITHDTVVDDCITAA